MRVRPLLAPSILSANFMKLAQELNDITLGGDADSIHLDIMDGHFVPNISFGPSLVKEIRNQTPLELDCHLMVTHPNQWIQPFVEAGVNRITIHLEAADFQLKELLNQIKNSGCKTGVALNPGTPLSKIQDFLQENPIDRILLMGVHPGFGGQKIIPDTIKKIEELVKIRSELTHKELFEIAFDGGVHFRILQQLYVAGVDVFIIGSAIFSSLNKKETIHNLKAYLNSIFNL